MRLPRHRVVVWPWLRRPGGMLLPNWLAITVWSGIFTWRPLTDVELAHELEHVRQWRRYGWRLPVAYFAASWQARRAGGQWYADNRFEIEARAAAERTHPA